MKVLRLLTKYLLQYKRVCIPHIGTFEIVQQSPQLDIADKHITAPHFRTRYLKQDSVPEHQVDFFTMADPSGKERLREELFSFGEKLKNKIEQSPFQWNGFGTLRFSSNEFLFESEPICLDSLQLVSAQKVIRQNAEHKLLVGDQQISSHHLNKAANRITNPGSMVLVIGWVLFAFAVLAIIAIFYMDKFQVSATGLRTHFNFY